MTNISENSLPPVIKATEVLSEADRVLQRYEENAKLLIAARIDPVEYLPPPETIISIDGCDFATLGNFSLIIGKAKSGKTFLMALFMAAMLKQDETFLSISGKQIENKSEILYFDTEQTRYHTLRSVNRICRLIGQNVPVKLGTYGLRKFTPAQRLELIEQKIYQSRKVGIVVIDGIRDLVTGINDEDEATMISSALLRWTEEKNIHIVVILHQNKNDFNARGHVGSELTNKAESVLSVTRDQNDDRLFIVEPEYCRSQEPRPFAFEISQDGLPIEAAGWQMRSQPEKKITVQKIPDMKLFQLFTESFSHEAEMLYGTLIVQVRLAFEKVYDKSLSDHKARSILQLAKNNGWIKQEKDRGRYILGEFTQNVKNEVFD